MKKAFTLIELMGVIALLGLIGLVVFPAILNQMKIADTEINEANKKLIYSAADSYINDHKGIYQSELDNDSDIELELNKLINEGYLSNNVDIKSYNYIKVSVRNGVSYDYNLIIKE